jgi:hypothetical protein
VTGIRFRSRKDPPLPETDVRAFRGHCYAAARALSGTVRAVELPYSANTNNHAIGTLDWKAGPVSVLLNAHFPLIGFAEPVVAGELSIRFVDSPALAEVFRGFGVYEVLGREALEQPVTREAVAELAKAEREQFGHWRPVRIGDVIFHCWG